MGDDNGFLKGPITRLFEKVAKWIGLSTNAGPVLAALFMESYETGNRMSSDDICRATGYSRLPIFTLFAVQNILTLFTYLF